MNKQELSSGDILEFGKTHSLKVEVYSDLYRIMKDVVAWKLSHLSTPNKEKLTLELTKCLMLVDDLHYEYCEEPEDNALIEEYKTKAEFIAEQLKHIALLPEYEEVVLPENPYDMGSIVLIEIGKYKGYNQCLAGISKGSDGKLWRLKE